MSSWFEEMRNKVGSMWGDEETQPMGPTPVELVPDYTPSLDGDELHPPSKETFLAPEAEIDPSFAEDFRLHEAATRGDIYTTARYEQQLMDDAHPAEQERAIRNMILQQENTDKLAGKGFHEAFFSGVPNAAEGWGLIDPDKSPGNIRDDE